MKSLQRWSALCAFALSSLAQASTDLPLCLKVSDYTAYRIYAVAYDSNVNPVTYVQDQGSRAVRLTEYQDTYATDPSKRLVVNAMMVGVAGFDASNTLQGLSAGVATGAAAPGAAMTARIDYADGVWTLQRSAQGGVLTTHQLAVVPCVVPQ